MEVLSKFIGADAAVPVAAMVAKYGRAALLLIAHLEYGRPVDLLLLSSPQVITVG
jgi:hypothetical protein